MTEMIAYCGLTCQTCQIYLATRQKNNEDRTKMRAEIVKLCKEHYGIEYKQEDIIDCDGCLAQDERLFSSSRKCAIRKCAKEKAIRNCAYCTDYACEKLATFFRTETAAKSRLDAIRRGVI